MKKAVLLLLGVVVLASVSVGGYFYFAQGHALDERHTTCLAAVIPSVVLHHQQEEIVQLIQDLAKETKESLAPEKTESVRPIFSARVDGELLKIAEAFQAQGVAESSSGVSDAMVRAQQFFNEDAPSFASKCLGIVTEAKTVCGTLEAQSEAQKSCLDPYSEKINDLVKAHVPTPPQ